MKFTVALVAFLSVCALVAVATGLDHEHDATVADSITTNQASMTEEEASESQHFRSMSRQQQHVVLQEKINSMKPELDPAMRFVFGDLDMTTKKASLEDTLGLGQNIPDSMKALATGNSKMADEEHEFDLKSHILVDVLGKSLCRSADHSINMSGEDKCDHAKPGTPEYEKCTTYGSVVSFLQESAQPGSSAWWQQHQHLAPDDLKDVLDPAKWKLDPSKVSVKPRADVFNLGSLIAKLCSTTSNICDEAHKLNEWVNYLEWCLDDGGGIIAIIIQLQKLIIDIRSDIFQILLFIHYIDVVIYELKIEIGIILACLSHISMLKYYFMMYFRKLAMQIDIWIDKILCIFLPHGPSRPFCRDPRYVFWFGNIPGGLSSIIRVLIRNVAMWLEQLIIVDMMHYVENPGAGPGSPIAGTVIQEVQYIRINWPGARDCCESGTGFNWKSTKAYIHNVVNTMFQGQGAGHGSWGSDASMFQPILQNIRLNDPQYFGNVFGVAGMGGQNGQNAASGSGVAQAASGGQTPATASASGGGNGSH
eukprot:GFYU01001328.1.p1 GENE.GFYU01001328.1~~GFYU01001328.1.p1  ORF type:complete len:535 (-),score=185.58 GFYU01001328.1:254-1858(-)